MLRRAAAAVLGMVLVVVLATVPAAGAVGERASGNFIDGTGAVIGQVQLEQLADNSVRMSLTLKDANVVKQGQHGIHFHAVGMCDGPDFMTAGGHFNPTNKQHGTKNPQGPHAGDLPNLPIDASTAAQSGYAATLTTTMITLSPGPTSIFDADGTALVIHANPDDEMTDPTGNSGGRIACAVLAQNAPGSLPSTGGGAAVRQRQLWQRVALLALVTLATTAAVVVMGRRRAIKGE